MKKTLIASLVASLVVVASPAFACEGGLWGGSSCGQHEHGNKPNSGGHHGDPKPNPQPAPGPVNNGGKGGDGVGIAGAAAGAIAGAVGTGISAATVGDVKTGDQNTAVKTTASLTGGNQTMTGATGNAVSFNSDSHDRVMILPATPQTPASMAPSTTVAVIRGECVPLVDLKKEKIMGVISGFFGNEEIFLGYTYEVTERLVNNFPTYHERRTPQSDGSILVERAGHRVIEKAAVVTVSGAKNITIGGFGTQAGGSAGGGSSSAMQRLVDDVRVESCMIESYVIRPKLEVEKTEVPAGRKVISYTGPQDRKPQTHCPKTVDGKVVMVPKTSPDQICGTVTQVVTKRVVKDAYQNDQQVPERRTP